MDQLTGLEGGDGEHANEQVIVWEIGEDISGTPRRDMIDCTRKSSQDLTDFANKHSVSAIPLLHHMLSC